jgi:hypothetical protein
MKLPRLFPGTFVKKNKWKILFVFLTCIFAVGGYAVNEDLGIDHISLVGKEKEHTLTGVETLKGRNLLLLNTRQIEEILVVQNPYLQSAKLQKSYPNKITLELSYYEPTVYLAVSEGYYLLSQDGRILEKIREDESDILSYPVIQYYHNLPYVSHQAGEYIDTHEVQDTLYIYEEAQLLGLEIQNVDIQSYHMIALNGKESSVYFSAEKDKEIVSEEMKKILRQLKIDGTSFRALNLRFERPVIEYY